MTFEEIKDHLKETLILTYKTEQAMPSLSEMKRRDELHQARMAEIRRRGEESHKRLQESYDRFMRRHGGQPPPQA